jgi:hypothetical protein
MDDNDNENEEEEDEEDEVDEVVVILSLKQIIKRIIRLPAFMCLVAQGYVKTVPVLNCNCNCNCNCTAYINVL